jgi:NADPH:quinone reductase-like Zn-dependent oxidoreductase
MAQRATAPFVLPLPDGLDEVTAAAIINPGNGAWLALTRRAALQPGETVLVLGATGVSGRIAVALAARMGAGRVIAAGRNRAICQAAALGKEWTPRELRHSFVSMLSADGVAVEDISHLVGHSSTRTTERIYRQELRPVIRTGAERMQKIFGR